MTALPGAYRSSMTPSHPTCLRSHRQSHTPTSWGCSSHCHSGICWWHKSCYLQRRQHPVSYSRKTKQKSQFLYSTSKVATQERDRLRGREEKEREREMGGGKGEGDKERQAHTRTTPPPHTHNPPPTHTHTQERKEEKKIEGRKERKRYGISTLPVTAWVNVVCWNWSWLFLPDFKASETWLHMTTFHTTAS